MSAQAHDPFWLQGFYPLPNNRYYGNRASIPDAERTWKLHSKFPNLTEAALDVDCGVGKTDDRSWRVIDIRTGLVVYPASMAGEKATEDGREIPTFQVESYRPRHGHNKAGWGNHSGPISSLKEARAWLTYMVNEDPCDSTGYPTKFRIVDIRTGDVIEEQALRGDTTQSTKLLAEAEQLIAAAKLLKEAAGAKSIKGRFAKEDKARDILYRLQEAR
ncbi:hypothetical protein CcrSwift_gp214 [Caulobacter phage CcrSwift]|uniref:Uncharacterized protein n=1 Tax=Caulobacter phage CcrSwift TaxID=2927984 RepID=K4K7C4_9CAUD|nr:hypothetical protein D870_gp207 [Caulobacter phage CcrSwift]AFU88532.1 hypothetical protein CcrSwift_gp214 [Caulobacter phage CcrSwift]